MTIIFDYDGTLHKTDKIYGISFRKAFENLVNLGYEKPHYYSDEYLSQFLGINSIEMWELFRPGLPEEIKKESSEIVGAEMINQIKAGNSVLYDGVPELLNKLKKSGHNLIILSNCKAAYQKTHRDFFNLDRWFSEYYNCQDFNFAPKTEIFKTIKENNEGPFIVIGDRSSDIEVGLKNDLVTIACDYGYGSEDELKEATYHVSSPLEIIDIVENLK